jgi:basic membrane protein A and related proteins
MLGQTNRRAFVAGLGGAAAWPLVAHGQQSALPIVGYVSLRSPNPDMTTFAPQKYLTGTVWNWCPFYTKAVDMVRKGTFAPGEFYGGLTDGTVSLAPINAAVPADVQKLVADKQAAISDGSFDYWKGPINTNQGAVAVADGKTLTIENLNTTNWLVEGFNGRIPRK